MGASVREIAKRAGVSVGTVSRIINGASNIDPEIQGRAILAMRELNYAPSSRRRKTDMAQGKRTWNIGVLYYGANSAYEGNSSALNAISSIEGACRKAGYQTMVELLSPGRFEMPRCVKDGKVDGVLFENPDKASGAIIEIAAKVPAVALNCYYPDLCIPQVCPDDYGSAVKAIEEILKLGHKRVAFVNAVRAQYSFKIRKRAYLDVMEAAGLFDPACVIELDIVTEERPCNETPPDMSLAAERLLALNPRPGAALVVNDWCAIGLYKALKARGVEPGRDLSVAAFDNLPSASSLLEPPLSSVDIPFKEIAEAAVETLLREIEGAPRRNSITMFPGSFIRRGSLTPPASARN